MATLNINGTKVTVDDSFLQLSHDEQNAAVEEISKTLADRAAASSQSQGASGSTDTGIGRLISGQPQKSTFGDRFESNLNSSASGFANGVPIVGPYFNEGLNKAEAGIRSLFSGDSYQNELDSVHAKENADIAANPVTHTLGEVGGAITATTPVMMAAPAAFGIGSGPILGRSVIAGATGAGIGATDAAVRSDLDPRQTALGAGVGFATGAAGPAIGRAIGAGVRYFTQPTDAISGLSTAARNYVTQELADPLKLSGLQGELARLGPQATLADASPEWMGVARGAASRPGSRDAIVQPLLDRQAAANARLGADLDASLGPAVVPSQVEATLANGRNAIAQQYGPVMASARSVDTQPLAETLDAASASLRGPERVANRQVRGYLNIPDVRVDGQTVLDPNPSALLQTRQAIDGLMATEQNPQVMRQLTEARQQVDDALAQAAPEIKAVDGQYSELARQSEALQQGRPIMNNGATALRPQEVDQMIQQGSLPQGQFIGPSGVPTRMQQGVRAELDRAAGTRAIDSTALKDIVRGEGDWGRQKLASLFGEDRANQALNAIDREITFRDTANRVTAGSDTAMGKRFGDFLDSVGKPSEVPSNLTAMGVAASSAKKVANAILEQRGEAQAAQFANDLGRVSIATGTPRDLLVQALIARAQQKGTSTASPTAQALIDAVLQSGGSRVSR